MLSLWKIEVIHYRITHEFFCYTRAIHSCTHVIHARCMDTVATLPERTENEMN